MYKTDKVAIILATYQGEQFLMEQLESLRKQTYKDWICYIHDDGSMDATVDIINDYCSRFPEHFMKVEGEKTGAAKDNFIFLLKQMDAPYVMCCDQDDVWLPDKIEKTLNHMRGLEKSSVCGEQEVPALVFTELMVVDQHLHVLAEKMSEIQKLACDKLETKDLALQNVVTGCTMMINHKLLLLTKESLEKAKDNSDIIMHDWWIALIASEFGKIEFLPEATIWYRQHANNSVGMKNVGSISYIVKKMLKIKEIKESLQLTQNQARLFSKIFLLPEDHIVAEYGRIHEKGWFRRKLFYKQHHMRKSGIGRQLGFFLVG